MRILLTNDDGIEAPGLRALYGAIRDLGEVHVVAPTSVQSATSHGVTFHKALVAQPRCVDHVCEGGKTPFEGTAVDGRPADCIKLAFAELVPQPIDLVISGMNAGANIGINVIYSGTVAAAIEAAVMGIPSIAVSLHLGKSPQPRWADAAAHARTVIDQILQHPLDPHTVLNLNVPILDDGQEPRGLRVAPISTSPIVDIYELEHEAEDARHFKFYGGMKFRHTPPGSDVEALFDRYMTLTPLHFDLTHPSDVQQWGDRLQAPTAS